VSLLPAESSFHERVQDCFSAYRGRGVMLSPLDVELLDAWAKKEVPFEVVARGMRQAAEAALFDAAATEVGLRSLASCRRKVEAEIKKYRAHSAKAASAEDDTVSVGEPLHLSRFKKQKALLRKLSREQPALAPCCARLLEKLPTPANYATSARQEELVHSVLLHALPWSKRAPLLAHVRALVQKTGTLSRGARLEAVRFHRAALLKRELQL
jgi:hypothetical protein